MKKIKKKRKKEKDHAEWRWKVGRRIKYIKKTIELVVWIFKSIYNTVFSSIILLVSL